MNPEQQTQSKQQQPTSADSRRVPSTRPESRPAMRRQAADHAAFDSEDQRPTRDALFAIYNQIDR